MHIPGNLLAGLNTEAPTNITWPFLERNRNNLLPLRAHSVILIRIQENYRSERSAIGTIPAMTYDHYLNFVHDFDNISDSLFALPYHIENLP